MFDKLQALGIGIISFALIIGVGSIVLHEFGGAVATCPSNYTYDTISGNETVWNTTTNTCQMLQDGLTQNGTGITPGGGAYTNIAYLNTELGTDGLAGWTPAIVAISVGMLFLGVFLFKGSRTY